MTTNFITSKLLRIDMGDYKPTSDFGHRSLLGTTLYVIATPDELGMPIATVLYNGFPILSMNKDYETTIFMAEDFVKQVNLAAFLIDIDEWSAELEGTSALDYTFKYGYDAACEVFAGQGHDFCHFEELLAIAMYSAYPKHLTHPYGR